MASECFAASACGTRMCSSAWSAVPMHVAAAMLTPASLIAAATLASAPGLLSTSITRSAGMTRDCTRLPRRVRADAAPIVVRVRILVVTQMWPSPAQPALCAFVARQVAALERLGADVAVASVPPGPGGVRAPLKWRRLFSTATAAARRNRPDVVLGHFLFPGG